MATKKTKITKLDTQTDNLAAKELEETATNKQKLLEQLETCPIIQIACERSCIGRSTYYKWRKEDYEFAKSADLALKNGVDVINDLAESKLIRAIQDNHMTAIIYWLKHRNGAYCENPLYRETHEIMHREISPEQEQAIRNVMRNWDKHFAEKGKDGKPKYQFDAHKNNDKK